MWYKLSLFLDDSVGYRCVEWLLFGETVRHGSVTGCAYLVSLWNISSEAWSVCLVRHLDISCVAGPFRLVSLWVISSVAWPFHLMGQWDLSIVAEPFLFTFFFFLLFTTVLSQWDFFCGKFRLLSLGKASCNRVALPNLLCMLGVLVFP